MNIEAYFGRTSAKHSLNFYVHGMYLHCVKMLPFLLLYLQVSNTEFKRFNTAVKMSCGQNIPYKILCWVWNYCISHKLEENSIWLTCSYKECQTFQDRVNNYSFVISVKWFRG